MSRITIAIACVSLLLASNSALGQRRVPGYANRPAISPYVNLFQGNNGGLNSYFSFVRPRLQLDQQIRQQNQMLQSNQLAVQRESVLLQQSIEQAAESVLTQRPTSSSTAIRRPAASFMNFGTFYPSNTNSVQTRR